MPTHSEDCIVRTSVICRSDTNHYSNRFISDLNSVSTCVPNTIQRIPKDPLLTLPPLPTHCQEDIEHIRHYLLSSSRCARPDLLGDVLTQFISRTRRFVISNEQLWR